MSSGADFNKDERRMAQRDGATLIKNSGRGETKGDAKKGNLLIDYKFTEKKSFALNNAEFEKLSSDAFKSGLEPAIVVIFDSTKRRAIMDWGYVLELQDRIKELEDEVSHLWMVNND
jgi:hypothetical protein